MSGTAPLPTLRRREVLVRADEPLTERVRLRRALICTLGPSSLRPEVITGLERAGVTSFRINLSHTPLAELDAALDLVERCSSVPICLDTEGPQIRTGEVGEGLELVAGRRVLLVDRPGRSRGLTELPLTPAIALEGLRPGTRLSVDFDSVVLSVVRSARGAVEARVESGGRVESRKAVTAYPSPSLPALSEKDLSAIRRGLARGVSEIAVSFCEHPSTLEGLRSRCGPNVALIAKIESREGVRNLEGIAERADALLLDRGDLSREVRLEAIPLLQKAILRKANALRVPVYVATNLLESMVTRRVPNRAEVNDVMNTLLDGADGLVLAAETAIGQYPVEAARMVVRQFREYARSVDQYCLPDLLGDHPLRTAPSLS